MWEDSKRAATASQEENPLQKANLQPPELQENKFLLFKTQWTISLSIILERTGDPGCVLLFYFFKIVPSTKQWMPCLWIEWLLEPMNMIEWKTKTERWWDLRKWVWSCFIRFIIIITWVSGMQGWNSRHSSLLWSSPSRWETHDWQESQVGGCWSGESGIRKGCQEELMFNLRPKETT